MRLNNAILKMKFPRREDYEYFVEEFSSLVSLRSPKTCFYVYGSFIRKPDFVPGRSDIDGGLILDSHFILPKQEAITLSKTLDECLINAEFLAELSSTDSGIATNFNLMDRGINRDGRFLTYDNTYADYIKANARVLTEHNFVTGMNGMNYKREALKSAAYNLRKVRNGLLMHFVDLRKNSERARKNILSSANVLVGMPKKLLECLGKEPIFENGAFFQTFREIFPEYNPEVFPEYNPEVYERAAVLRSNPRAYFGVLDNTEEAFDMSIDFVSATEEMIKAYVKKFPFISQREIRTLD